MRKNFSLAILLIASLFILSAQAFAQAEELDNISKTYTQKKI